MDDPNITWRTKKPDYTLVNELYMKERTRHHKAGSVEKLVENLVKTWEMESTHKPKLEEWGTIDREKFTITVNGGRKLTAEDNVAMGNYNMFLEESILFDTSKYSNDESHAIFKKAFPDTFAWELLELLSGPPTVSFTWRHWANWTGPYKDKQPTGELMEMFGVAIVKVNDDLKVLNLDIYYDPHPFMAKFYGGKCPFAKMID